MAAREILASTVDALASASFEASDQKGTLPCTIMVVPNLAGGETAIIEITHDDGVTWTPLKINGIIQGLDIDNNVKSIYGPGEYRINKDATTSSTLIALLTNKRL